MGYEVKVVVRERQSISRAENSPIELGTSFPTFSSWSSISAILLQRAIGGLNALNLVEMCTYHVLRATDLLDLYVRYPHSLR